jgi:hypothetical protein
MNAWRAEAAHPEAAFPPTIRRIGDCMCIAATGLTTRFDETNPISLTTIHSDRSPIPVGLCVDSRRWAGPRRSIVVASIGRQVLPATDTETAPSVLWFATIQGVEGKQDLADLAPKDGFIPAEPVERVAGQIGKAQKATREVGGGVDRFWARAGHGFNFGCAAVRSSIGIGIDRFSASEHRVDYFS